MKRIVFIISIFLVLIGCKNSKETSLTFNREPAEKFIDVMNYIETKTENGFTNDETSQELIDQNFQSNSQDISLNQKIDSLLSLTIYNDLEKLTSSFIDTIEYKGREGYRIAFLNLPSRSIPMKGGLSEQWVEFWINNYDSKVIQFLQQIESQENIVTKDVLINCYKLLPENLEPITAVEVLFCFDGNRGSYAKDSTIIMDMLDFSNFELSEFSHTLAHELHHIIYGQWLSEKLSEVNMTSKQEALLSYQKRIIFEGIAQQINYEDYSEQVKNLYNNEQLIVELFNEWIVSMREITKSEKPYDTFNHLHKEMWGNSMSKLKKYCPDIIEEETIPRRPTTDYYISYHLYHSIFHKGGLQKLNYVIENYDCLLEEYNNIYSEDLLIPRIPDDILEIWKNNFKSNNT